MEHCFSIPNAAIPPQEPAIGLRPASTPDAMPRMTNAMVANTTRNIIKKLMVITCLIRGTIAQKLDWHGSETRPAHESQTVLQCHAVLRTPCLHPCLAP